MKKWKIWALALALFTISACDEEDFNVLGATNLTTAEIISGLKSALTVGTDTATSILSVKDGYFKDEAVKILMPKDVQRKINQFKARNINLGIINVSGADLYDGFQNTALGINIPNLQDQEDAILLGLNRAAESAASEAGPIFVNAITGMTITEASDILFNKSDTAATHFLRKETSSALFAKYEPKIDNAVNKVTIGNTSVAVAYENFVSDYNAVLNISLGASSIGTLMNIEPIGVTNTSEFATWQGLNGLFLKISEEEKAIREDPLARVNDILERVFGQL